MDNTQIAYSLLVGGGIVAIYFSIMRTKYLKSIEENIIRLRTIIEDMIRNMAEQEFVEDVPKPITPPQPVQVQPVPAQTPEPVKEQVQETPKEQPQPVKPKKSKQDFAQRVKEMNEAKKKKRLEKELAMKQAEMDKLKQQIQ